MIFLLHIWTNFGFYIFKWWITSYEPYGRTLRHLKHVFILPKTRVTLFCWDWPQELYKISFLVPARDVCIKSNSSWRIHKRTTCRSQNKHILVRSVSRRLHWANSHSLKGSTGKSLSDISRLVWTLPWPGVLTIDMKMKEMYNVRFKSPDQHITLRQARPSRITRNSNYIEMMTKFCENGHVMQIDSLGKLDGNWKTLPPGWLFPIKWTS